MKHKLLYSILTSKGHKNPLCFLFFTLLLLLQSFGATANPFVTRWNLATAGSGATQLSFGVETSGTVNYTWTTVPAGTSGSGTFSGITANITGLPAGTIIDLSIAPAGFQRININNGVDRLRLIGIQQWGDVVWNSMASAFNGCSNMVLNATDIPNTAAVTDMSSMFNRCISFNQALPNGFNTSNVTNVSSMFYGCSSYNQILPNSFNTSNVTDMSFMFRDCIAYNQAFPSSFNTSSVTNMNSMFYGCSAYNQVLSSNFNTASVTDMSFMFQYCVAFNQALPSSFNTSSVTNMANMFNGCIIYNQALPSSFNTSSVTNMANMFNGCRAYNQVLPISFNTSSVTNMNSMFYFCNAYNQVLPSSFNTSSVTNMYAMFQSCTAYNQPLPSSFNTSNVLTMGSMFYACSAYNQAFPISFSTASVTNMGVMFAGATAFDQNVGNFNISSATNMGNIFFNSGISISNYDAILIAWNAAGYTNKNLGNASPLKYCLGQSARTSLTTTKGWTITGDASAAPVAFTMTGGGAYCAGGSGVAIGISNSESGVTYQLRNGASNVGSPVSGIGAARSFGNQTVAGTYTVLATRTAGGCTSVMTGSVNVTVNAIPTVFNLTGSTGVALSLSGSQTGMNYQLKRGGTTNVGSTITGTGASLSFGVQSTAGTYTVLATSSTGGCTASMTGSIVITTNPFVTRWNLATAGSGSTQLSFGVGTSGTVNYTWTTVPVGTSGSGTFSGTLATITGLPAGTTIDLSIAPANFQRINIGNGTDRNRLISIRQWGDVVWSSMQNAFAGCQNMVLNATDIPNSTNVTNMSSMFAGCSTFNQALTIGFNTTNVTNMSSMFAGCTAYNQALPGSFNTTNVTNMSSMFNGCNAYNQVLPNSFNTSSVTDMSFMFRDCISYNQAFPSIFNTSSVTNMNGMFYGCSAYNQVLPSSFNTSSVTNMVYMFCGCSAYNQVLPSSFNTSSVTNMVYMFSGCTAYNQALPSSFNTGAVTSMNNMFSDCSSYDQPLPGSFNTSNVTNMAVMFSGCSVYNQPLPSSFNTSNVTDMSAMFYQCSSYNQAFPSSFNTANVIYFNNMFRGATSFDQNIGHLIIRSFSFMTDMFLDSGISISNYDAMLMAWDDAGYTNKNLGNASPLRYCEGKAARTSLVTTKGWTITGDSYAGPSSYTLTGGGAYCAGGSGVDIGLSNSESGVTYQLMNGASNVGSSINGTGAAISFGNQTAAGAFTVVATRTSTGCTTTMTGSQTVSINAAASNAALATNAVNGVPLTESCTENGWTYYVAPTNPSAYLFAVAWGSANNAARSSAVVSLHLNTALYGSTASSSVSGQGIPTGTWVMPRSWNVNTGGVALTVPVSVRFFYDQNEANNVQQAATDFASLHNLSAQSIEPFVWFKTVGVAYEPQNFNGTTLNANGVYRGQSIELQSTNGTENGVAYAEFSNIQSFSGGTGAAGVGNGNPLPIALEYFRGEKLGEKSLLTWRTQTELNNSHFVVERSNNGIDFVAIGRVDGSGNSSTPLNYSFMDEVPHPGNNYYRLRQLDFDGTEKRSGIVVLHFEKAFAVITYPNPFEESFTIDVVTTGASEGLIEVFDMTGRLISSEKEVFTEGGNRKVVNAQVWMPGAYIVKVSTAGFTSYGTVVKSTF